MRLRFLLSSLALSLVACGGSDPPSFEGDDAEASGDAASGDTTGDDSSSPDASADSTPSDTAADEGDGTCATPGSTDSRACGKCGSQLRICGTDGRWTTWTDCSGETGTCLPGSTDTATCVDGRKQTRTCDATCSWGPYGACEGTPTCTPGATDTQSCGKCGSQVRVCSSSMTWSDWSACSGEGACAVGATESVPCGVGGTQTRTCSSSCTWGAYGSCVGTTGCTPGATDTQSCGKCGSQVRVCSSASTWSDWSTCGGEGVCAVGATKSQSCGGGGTQSATCDATCNWGAWGFCSGGTDPTELWVAAVTTSTTTGQSAAVSIERVGVGGALLGTLAMPTATAGSQRAFTVSATRGGDTQLIRSVDGRWVTLAGYAVAPGYASVETTDSATVNRVLARINAAGTIDTTSATTALSAGAIRGASSIDGSGFYAFGEKGLVYVPYGGGPGTVITPAGDATFAAVFGGELYVTRYISTTFGGSTSEATVLQFPGVPPKTSATPTAVINSNPTSCTFSNCAAPFGVLAFAVSSPTIDTIYIADDFTGIQHWKRSGTTWSKIKTMLTASGETILHLAGFVQSGTGQVVLYGSVQGTSSSRIDRYVDNGGATAPTPTAIRTAPAGKKYRGIAFAPN